MNQADRLRGVAVVIPAYNEKASIAKVAAAALEVVEHVIVVDDGSTDGTSEQLLDLSVVLLRHNVNCGKAAALMTGLREAMNLGVSGAVTMDGHGQHRASDVRRLAAVAEAKPEAIVIGSRLHDSSKFSAARLKANKIANFWVSWAAGQLIEDSQSGFRYYPVDLLRCLRVPHGRNRSFVFESEILIAAARKGVPITSVEIPAIYGAALQRKSHFRPVADIARIALSSG